jgi:hypothetical protein
VEHGEHGVGCDNLDSSLNLAAFRTSPAYCVASSRQHAVANQTQFLFLRQPKSFEINTQKLALRLPFESPVTRAAKISAAMLALLLVCAGATLFLHPRPARGFARRVFHWRSGDIPFAPADARAALLPNVTFWAWERPEDLRFLPRDRAGVAFLAKTILLETPPANSSAGPSSPFIVRPRLRPLRITPGTQLIAVVRIETPSAPHTSFSSQQNQSAPHSFPIISDAQRTLLASEIADLQSIPGVSAVQIDFDAPASAHGFYASLLRDVRRKLPPSMPLSITALAFWCIGDPWLSQLPPGTIDEAVPMLFRMGPDAANVARFLHSDDDFPVVACRGTLGLSTDEPISHDLLTARSSSAIFDRRAKRIYIFAPRAWTPSAAQNIIQELQP